MKKFFGLLVACFISMSAFAAGVTCDYNRKIGCWEAVAISVTANPVFAGLEAKAEKGSGEFTSRTNELGPRVYAAYQQGMVDVGSVKSYIYYYFGFKKLNPKAYAINGRQSEGGRVSDGKVENVTGKVIIPKFADEEKLGTPQVFRVHVVGEKAFGVSLQVPWTAATDNAVVMIVAEQETLFPAKNQAQEFPRGVITTLKEAGATASLAPFISPAQNNAPAKVASAK